MQDMTKHIREAIELNKERMPKYAALTNGASVPFSKELINTERMGLMVARLFDCFGDLYQKKGIPIVKEEMVDMAEVGPFQEHFPAEIDYTRPFVPIDIEELFERLKKELKKRAFLSIQMVCADGLEILKRDPHHYCMLRHILESIQRVAHLAPLHHRYSLELELKSTLKVSTYLINSHMWVLRRAYQFDQNIAFIQQMGVPFLYQDLPHVGIESEFYKKVNLF